MTHAGLLLEPDSRHVALVTAASRGVGAVVAQKLALDGRRPDKRWSRRT